MIYNPTQAKAAIRKQMLVRLQKLTPQEAAEQSRQACQGAYALPSFQSARVILAYRALPGECDPAYAVSWALEKGKTVAFPRCGEGHKLQLFVPLREEAFQRGAYGIWEPIPAYCEEIGPQELDFILAPGLAFDAGCRRLGRGGGYYDRLLCETKAFCLGLGFTCQLIPLVPEGDLDQPMDAVSIPGILYKR